MKDNKGICILIEVPLKLYFNALLPRTFIFLLVKIRREGEIGETTGANEVINWEF